MSNTTQGAQGAPAPHAPAVPYTLQAPTAPRSAPPAPPAPTVSSHYAGLPDGVTYLHGVLYDTRPFVTYDPTRSTPDYLYTPSPRLTGSGTGEGGAQ